MPIDFHKDMDKYLTNKRRKRLFSDIKSKVMNKKAVVSYKTKTKFDELKGKLTFKVDEIKNKRKEAEKEITQEDINELVRRKGVIGEPVKRVEPAAEETEEEGWKEIRLESFQKEEEDLSGLEEEKRKIQENLAEIETKRRAEKKRILKFSQEKEQREKAESEEERTKRLELEEEVSILKEKQRIEEDRLTELRKARRREQMDALKGRVMDILFKKRPKKEKDMAEEVRKEIRMGAKVGEAERQKATEKNIRKPKEEVAKNSESEKIEEVKKEEEKEPHGEEKPKQSFFSNFIQIRTAEQIAKEEEARLKREEEEALKDQSQINVLFEQEGEEVRSNVPEPEEEVNVFSTLFPDEQSISQRQTQDSGDFIDLGKDYKIKVLRNE